MKHIFYLLALTFILTACATTVPLPTPTPVLISPTPTATEAPTATAAPTETSTPEVVEFPEPAEGWNSVIAEGLAIHPEGHAWVDKDGFQHFKFQDGENVSDEQKIKELKVICKDSNCIHSDGRNILITIPMSIMM